ncbi:basic leucine zipper 23-like [Canna indica]|uniref:Basic leucine zipper 23-like n=1 Tax=Canna indica TaxID=4628 RepID=A0AAQ3KYW4_9LILI|nr:basic leucine zipper 23-like [Canna indica]
MDDDTEGDLSSQLFYPNPDMLESFDEFMKTTRTCTHTHTSNPPAKRTHTCYHTHTQVLATGEGNSVGGHEPTKPRKPLGNKEAVRKYREKKKAQASFLEEEAKKLRVANQQLVRRLQGQAVLVAEVARLRSLLVDVREKIDAQLFGVTSQNVCQNATEWQGFPFQNQCNPTGFQCDSDDQCINGKPEVLIIDGKPEVIDREGSCMPATTDCKISRNTDIMRQTLEIVKSVKSMDVLGSLLSSSAQTQ